MATKYILDGRTYDTFNKLHIEGSISVGFPVIIIRRIIANPSKFMEFVFSNEPNVQKIKEILNEKSGIVYYLHGQNFSDELQKSLSTYYGTTLIFMNYDEYVEQNRDSIILVPTEFKVLYPITMSPPQTPDGRYEISEILPGLYLSGEEGATDKKVLNEKGIEIIINMTDHIPFKYEGEFTYHRFPLLDQGTNDIKKYFDPTFYIIDKALSEGKKVLVHCQAGISRSATIVIAYIMRKQKLLMNQSLQFVYTKRKCISPNLGFCGQLIMHEKEFKSW
jgi:dual specificity MAP kinase phosphatase